MPQHRKLIAWAVRSVLLVTTWPSTRQVISPGTCTSNLIPSLRSLPESSPPYLHPHSPPCFHDIVAREQGVFITPAVQMLLAAVAGYPGRLYSCLKLEKQTITPGEDKSRSSIDLGLLCKNIALRRIGKLHTPTLLGLYRFGNGGEPAETQILSNMGWYP